MKIRSLFIGLLSLMLAGVSVHAQNKLSSQQEKILFPSKNTELLTARGDSLLLLHSLPNRKELWIYRGSTGSLDKRHTEIFYNAQSVSLRNGNIASYDVVLNRFIFSSIEKDAIKNYMGGSLNKKGVIGVSVPSLFPTNIGWLELHVGNFAYSDNKLYCGLLDSEGQWMIPSKEAHSYPEDQKQEFGLVNSYTAISVDRRIIMAAEVSADHYLAKENQRQGKMFVLSELDDALNIVKEAAIIDDLDKEKLEDESAIRTYLDLLYLDNAIALVVRAGVNIYVKLFNNNFVLIKNIIPNPSPEPIIDSYSLTLKNGFVVVYTSGDEVRLTYINKNGVLAKDRVVYKSTDSRLKLKCLLDNDNINVVIRDGASRQIIYRTISRLDLE